LVEREVKRVEEIMKEITDELVGKYMNDGEEIGREHLGYIVKDGDRSKCRIRKNNVIERG
jgi:hypothetical protein